MSNTDTKVQAVSLSNLNEVEACSHAEEMTFKDSEGELTNIKLMVLGTHAQVVQDGIYRQIDQSNRQEFKQKKAGRVVEPALTEEHMSKSIASIALRIVGWSGISEPWTPKLALQFCTQNPSGRAQVQEFSEDLGNFGNSKG